jgi:hypothetical protein
LGAFLTYIRCLNILIFFESCALEAMAKASVSYLVIDAFQLSSQQTFSALFKSDVHLSNEILMSGIDSLANGIAGVEIASDGKRVAMDTKPHTRYNTAKKTYACFLPLTVQFNRGPFETTYRTRLEKTKHVRSRFVKRRID